VKLSPEMKEQVSAILSKEVPTIFFELASKIEPRINKHKFLPSLLAYKMEPNSARIVLALPDEEWKSELGEFKCSDAFAQRLGMDKEYINSQLEERYYSGEILWTSKGGSCVTESGLWHDLQNSQRWIERNGKAYYKIIGMFVEQEIIWVDQAKTEERIKTGQMGFARIVPRYDSVKDNPELLPAENMKEMLKSAKCVSQNRCACRISYPELEANDKVCISLNNTAKWAEKMEIGKVIPWEEAFEFIQAAGKKEPHCHINKHTDKIEEIGEVVCSCNVNSCIVLKAPFEGKTKYPVSEYYGKSRFRAVIDSKKCINCGLCAKKRCMFKAIDVQYNIDILDECHHVSEQACMGCGCCVETCPTGAIKMVCVEPPEFLKGYRLNGNVDNSKKVETYWNL